MDSCSDKLGINISKMRNVFKQIVNYEKLGIHAPFKRDCFGHPLYKVRQYTTFDEKVSSNLQPMNIKVPQYSMNNLE
jgi:hypothetical protein